MERRPLFNSEPTPTPSPSPEPERLEVADEGEGEPAQKKARFTEVLELSDDSDDAMEVEEKVLGNKKKDGAGPSQIRSSPKPPRDWETHFFGDFVTSGWTLCRSGAFTSLKPGDAITLHRPQRATMVDEKKAKKDDIIIRFKNPKGVEVGRIGESDASWMAKLMDLQVVTFTGTCVDAPKAFQTGDTVVLSISLTIHRAAFSFGFDINPIITGPDGKKTFQDDLKETPNEKKLRERKFSLNRLLDKVSLEPVTLSAISSDKKGKGKAAKRNLFEDYDGMMVKRKDAGGEEEEEEEMDVNQLNQIYSKALKNDAFLPEMDPPASFKFSLRGYQKQALKWMSTMEGAGEGDARESLSMHPLWEEYRFPHPPNEKGEEDEAFYYNPCSGELSLEFPKASKSCSGGILADEMGLGKTIMVAALIHTNTPQSIAAANGSPSSSATPPPADSSDNESDDEKPYIPSPVRKVRVSTAGQKTQSRLGKAGLVKKKSLSDKTVPTATLVVAPMTLLSQWCSELEKSSDNNLTVLMYYGSSRTSIQEEIESGVDVVVTSYGTLVSDFKKSGGGTLADATKKGKAKEAQSKPKPKTKQGLYSVEWFRVVLDEAHLVKSRSTQNAKATYALRAARRWCLTGTPIVKLVVS